MTSLDSRDIPADPTSAERLAARSLTYRLIDTANATESEAFQRAMSRGFLGSEPSTEVLAFGRSAFEARRNIGVYESSAPAGAYPVGTIDSWVTPLTLPGGATVPMWAISGVTVAATHRRQGIARALLEGELRAASSAGVSVAGLTVSEATIYGRYGFGSAVPVAGFTVDTRRAGWGGVMPAGRFEFIGGQELVNSLGEVHDRARALRPGQIPGWISRWEGHSGLSPRDTDKDKVRGVRYFDGDGHLRGVLVFTLTERSGSFRFSLDVRLLVAESHEATVALWGFALQHDLVDEVTADLRPLDDPLPWLVNDPRGVTQVIHDHGWLRILDVPSALVARHYSAPLNVVVQVDDPLGIAAGSWRIHVDSYGRATVDRVERGNAVVALDVAALSALFVGGVRAESLYAAGRIQGAQGSVDALGRAFTSYPAASLDIWY